MQTERSIPELTKDVAFHLGDMFRNELKLARVEATESVEIAFGRFRHSIVTGAAVGGGRPHRGTVRGRPMRSRLESCRCGAAAAIVAVVAGDRRRSDDRWRARRR